MNVKRIIILLLIAFLLFFVITQPTASAAVVQNILTALANAATAIGNFLTSIF